MKSSQPSQTKISLLVPTRQRKQMFLEFYNSAMELANHPGLVEVVYYTDDDDNSYDDLDLFNAIHCHGGRIILSEMWNKCWEAATGEIFGHMGDDILFRTEGWDDVVRNLFAEYPDRIAFMYGDDRNEESQRNEFGTHGFIHKNWTDVIGRFVPPYFSSDYNDTWFNDVAIEIGRRFQIPIVTEHMHFSLGKSEKDQNTIDRLARHEKDHPEGIYNSREKRVERQDEIEKLRQFIDHFTA